MKKIVVIIAMLIVALLGISYFTGVLPFGLFDDGVTTKTYNIGGIKGNVNYELLDSKGYILSYKDEGHSEKITCRGKLSADTWATGVVTHYYYLVYLKKNVYSSYELLSAPDTPDEEGTSRYFAGKNPGVLSIGTLAIGGSIYCQTYGFELISNDYATGAIKVELWGRVDENQLNPFDDGFKWYRLASDEAYLYSGYGELILPTGLTEEGLELPHTTFEIGQTVKIGVGTAKGGYTSDGKPWRVTLNEPYGGSITDPEDGGGVVAEKFFPNDCDSSNTFFEFVVTEDMATKSMSSPYFYTVRIWNTLLPLGTVQVDMVDFLYKCPGLVTFGGDSNKIKVDEYATVTVNADVNSVTQASIDYFRICVCYGTSDTLMPSSQTSERWIVHTTNFGGADKTACSLPQSVTFKPTKESYVTVYVKAVDIQGRTSLATSTRQLWAWGVSGEPPDDAVDTGDDYWGGGHTEPWLPWEPSEGDWPTAKYDFAGLIDILIAIVIIAIAGVIAFLMPIPGKPLSSMIVFIIGILCAIAFLLFF